MLKYHKTLKEYRYVDEVDEIKIDSYIRWFNLNKIKEIKLTNGGIIIDIKNGKEDILIVCKNNMNRIFTLQLSQCFIFQKMNDQENID